MFDIGIDIEDINRFKKYSIEKDLYFLETIFSKKELEYCFTQSLPAKHLAARFCAKEAFIKALPVAKTKISFNEISVLIDENGKPYIKTDVVNGKIKVSLSHEKEKAAVVVLIELQEENK